MEVCCGVFDAEAHWRDSNLIGLPSVANADRQWFVSSLDELLLPLVPRGGSLLTYFRPDPDLLQYWHDVGLNTNHAYLFEGPAEAEPIGEPTNLFQVLLDKSDAEVHALFGATAPTIRPYAVIEPFPQLAKRFEPDANVPDVSAVRRVNSKAYSFEMHAKIGVPSRGHLVQNSSEFKRAAESIRGPVVVKDFFGVSGSGSLLLESAWQIQRIARHIEVHENQGGSCGFLVEPLLPRALEFSSLYEISTSGVKHLISVQQFQNNGFCFAGSHTASETLVEELTRDGYFETTDVVLDEIRRSGYHGSVCIDSMILTDGTLVPVIEINARKSLSLVSFHLDEFLKPFGLTSFFSSLELSADCSVNVGTILRGLESNGQLWSRGARSGIVPLSGNTLRVISDRHRESGSYRSRFYFSVVAEGQNEFGDQVDRIKGTLSASGIRVLS